MFKAEYPSYSSLKTTYITIPLRRQMANSDFTDGFETMSEQTSNLLFGLLLASVLINILFTGAVRYM